MSRHLQQKFCYISSRQFLDNIFSPILKNSGKEIILLKNNYFRVSHMGCEARFLSLMVFLSFPQLNFIFRASILNCTAAFFARFRYFQKGCSSGSWKIKVFLDVLPILWVFFLIITLLWKILHGYYTTFVFLKLWTFFSFIVLSIVNTWLSLFSP